MNVRVVAALLAGELALTAGLILAFPRKPPEPEFVHAGLGADDMRGVSVLVRAAVQLPTLHSAEPFCLPGLIKQFEFGVRSGQVPAPGLGAGTVKMHGQPWICLSANTV
jgi:hypothetical protein